MKSPIRKEDAVSPVIGVMLMLVVTIIIAAVITGFAMDLSKDTEKTPTAFFEAQYVKGENGNYVFGLKHKGGDPVRLQDVELTLEQVGGVSTNQIITVLPGAGGLNDYGERYNPLLVRGQEDKKSKAVVTTGDVIQVTPGLFNIPEKATAKWTLTYTKTKGLIANGEFFVIRG